MRGGTLPHEINDLHSPLVFKDKLTLLSFYEGFQEIIGGKEAVVKKNENYEREDILMIDYLHILSILLEL